MDHNNLNHVDKNLTLEEIEIELQKTEILLEQLDLKMTEENKDLYLSQYLELKEKYNDLLAQKKKLDPREVTFWEKVPLWMIIYALLIFFVVGIPYVSWMIWIFFAEILPLNDIALSRLIINLVIYTLPLITLFLSWFVYANFVHQEFHKKVFRYLWLAQAIIIILNGVILYFTFLK